MSYLLDRKIKRKKFFKVALGVIVLLLIIYFHTSVFGGLSRITHSIFRPVFIFGNNLKEGFSNVGSAIQSKKSLTKENESLKSQLSEKEATLSNYNSVLDENAKLKEIFGRKSEKSNMILGAILSKPNRSPYDTLIIDVGAEEGVAVGDKVFAQGSVPIGRVSLVYSHSAKVILFSTAGEKTEVVVSLSPNPLDINSASGVASDVLAPLIQSGKDVFMQLVGRGGGNFEMILPRDFILEKGTEVHLPGITPYVVATVATIISDPRDSFIKALLVSPVNIQELKFVQVLK
jgi:cell shape-determining protein MreC